jgi:hypothetical protein
MTTRYGVEETKTWENDRLQDERAARMSLAGIQLELD